MSGRAASGTLRLRVGGERGAVYRMRIIGRESRFGVPTRTEVPGELAAVVDRVKSLELRLEAQEKEIEALENEAPSTT